VHGGRQKGGASRSHLGAFVRNASDPLFGQRLRDLREAAGLSLRQFGALSNYSHGYLWELEAGRKRPSEDTAARLDQILGAGGQLAMLAVVDAPPTVSGGQGPEQSSGGGLQFPPTWRQGVDAATELWRWDLQRRDLMGSARFAASAFIGPAMRWLTAPLDERPAGTGRRVVDVPDVDTIRQVTSAFRTIDNRYGGGQIRVSVVRFLHTEVTPLLRDGLYDGAVGASLLSAAAEMTRLAGWAAYDSGMQGLAQMYLIQALRLAMAAGDRPLGAEILAAMSTQAAYLHAPGEAIDLARAAAQVAADAGISAISAEAAVLEAQGHAIAGDEPACAAALDRAERTLDRADRSSDPQWIRYFDEAYLSAKFGHCFTALGRGELAQRFAGRSLEMDARRYVRGRQFNLALLATAHVQAGEVEQAAVVGVEAVHAAEGLRSRRAVDYIAALADRLAPHVGLPAVRDFTDQARSILQPVTIAR
jgi:transcriptional regulator with XRE-family HTH domain